MKEGFVGYNDQKLLNELKGAIDLAATNTADIVTEKMQEIVTKIEAVMFTPDAKSYFDEFVKACASIGPGLTANFDAFYKHLGKASNVWAEQTGAATVELKSISEVAVEVSNTVKDVDENGNRGVYLDEAIKVSDWIRDNVVSEINDALSPVKTSVDASTTFLGGNQAEAVTELFSKVVDLVDRVLDFLTVSTANHDSVEQQIRTAATNYGNLATEMAANIKSTEITTN